MALTWAQFKTYVLARMTDIVPSDSFFTEACAQYVKSYLSREIDHDILMAKSYQDRYKDLRRRLLGYATTLVPGSTLDTAVKIYLPVDATRQGVQPLITQLINNSYLDLTTLATFIDRAFREAAIDIQTLVPCYRITQTTTYDTSDVVQVGGLSRGQMPQGAQFYEAYYLQSVQALAENVTYQIGDLVTSNGRTYVVLQGGLVGTGLLGSGLQTTDGSVETLGGMTFSFRFYEAFVRSKVKQYDWHDRYEFDRIPSSPQNNRRPASIMIDKDTSSFYVWPFLNPNPPAPIPPETYTPTFTYVVTWTNPTMFTLADSDIVPFDEEVGVAIAAYVWSKFYGSVEQDRMQAEIHAKAYASTRSKLVAECAAKGRLMYTT